MDLLKLVWLAAILGVCLAIHDRLTEIGLDIHKLAELLGAK